MRFPRAAIPYIAALACLVTFVPSVAAAQRAPDRWRAQVELGFNGSFGNSSFSILRTGGSVTRLATELYELEASGLVRYGKSQDRVIADDQRGSLKFDWHPDDVFSPFTFVTANRDRIRRIDLRLNAGAGAKWTFSQREKGKASLSLAALVDHENLRLAAGSTETEVRGVARWSARLKVDQSFSTGATFQHVTFWQPQVDRFGDYLIEMTNSMSTRLLSRFSLAIEHEYLHDQVPPNGVKRDDQKLSVVLRVAL